MSKKALGRGLSALIDTEVEEIANQIGMKILKINEIEPNINQPRRVMNDTKLQELCESIKNHGIVQPIIVNQENGVYRIIAGERRWRAARLAGLTEVPVIIRELSNKEVMEVALIENIQREDLNPIEEAEAYERLVQEHKITHEELSGIIGKSRPAITNTMRLLGLSNEVKGLVATGAISSGHARTLLGIASVEIQTKMAKQIAEKGISVRETEKIIKEMLSIKNKKKRKITFSEYDYLANDLQEFFGTKVKILCDKNNKGRITIDYYNHDDLQRIIDKFDNIKYQKK